MQDWSTIWYDDQLDVGSLRAFYVDQAFPRHSHDYYVICLVARGLQSFSHKGTKHYTPAGGVILINPEAVHTGEAACDEGFEMICLYPTAFHMQRAVAELTGRRQGLPFFKEVRVDHSWAMDSIVRLHRALTHPTNPMESESRFLWTLAQLIKHYADSHFDEQSLGQERNAVRQARCYIEERFAEGITISQLADHVALSPYYLLRVFRAEVGMPPFAYLDSVRIRQAQRLIKAGRPLAEVAAEVGYSSQSHLTRRFKRIIGVTPGQFARQLR